MQKSEAEGEEKAKAPPEREIARGTGVQKSEAEGEEKMKSPAGAGGKKRHRRAKRRGRRRGEDEKPRRGGK